MIRRTLLLAFLASVNPLPACAAQESDPAARRVLAAAIDRMGGEDALRGIERVRLEMMTQWQRTSFDIGPYGDAPSYERHTELRDYTVPAWRNTRRFPFRGEWQERTDVVRDSVAIRRTDGAWSPLNVAYVDERRELFTFAPERVLLFARDAEDLRLLPDTVIGGTPHRRVAATLRGYPTTLFLRRSDGLPAMVRYRAAHPNDFGLAPWGEMEVEVWFSRWQTVPGGISIPTQWDVRRVGRPYKRMSVLAATFDPPVAADSFAVSDSLRRAFFATQNKPMHDVPLDSARILEGRFAQFTPVGGPAGAVRLGDEWLLLEAGQARLNLERAVEWLRAREPATRLAGAVVTYTAAGNGGVAALHEADIPMHVGSGAVPYVRTILHNHGLPTDGFDVISHGRWLPVAGDSVWAEPIDLPDARGATLLYVPSLRWVYCSMAFTPLDVDLVLERARSRRWQVGRVGTRRGLLLPLPST